ncbi:5-methyltetrahydropteroyltriglutamate-homocysteine-S-methyltransferase [Cavenderia fasciculata]|uniref:5-methyltetrahydropteroyltriglutamate--homocysteine S-methyltransferase n=1 Tax=Cavenderia fasciculata TaxID=261658 RepID=F4PJN8_CACFS|nr:5-methyltetrahydropteroyltriglutamate-homocysteine-S-methyltransferase [Cavenderia fasciculata]EGG23812.1 5-methyltetrahydropteroyltriglutamate-homocysteine-S-methyltransferase [Cavenderia fasciculata]|eukprot:XP_004361663.1 5-methyltetrahydropteroyltriglutamate-homocysteine-S-methyltransferase [Cavenderia fasciculata]
MRSERDGFMAISTILGFPRMGENRDLKKIVEAFWQGKVNAQELVAGAAKLREVHWALQKNVGIDLIPSNDFSFYDHVLDHVHMFGAIPTRYEPVVASEGGVASLATYFAMGRGLQNQQVDVCSMEMRKWFDTNYHYMVPELQANQTFKLTNSVSSTQHPKIVEEYLQAKEALGINSKPVLIGPISFLMLSKSADNKQYASLLDPLVHIDSLLAVYTQIVTLLQSHGATDLQVDEPFLCFDFEDSQINTLKPIYHKVLTALHTAAPSLRIHLTTYFGEIGSNIVLIKDLDFIHSVHIDLTRSLSNDHLDTLLLSFNKNWNISLGLIDGRNIWITNYQKKLQEINRIINLLKIDKSKIIVASSCSLLHSPHSAEKEKLKPVELLEWLSFAKEKLAEVVFLTKAVNAGYDVSGNDGSVVLLDSGLQEAYATNLAKCARRSTSAIIHNVDVKDRANKVTQDMFSRNSVFEKRRVAQRQRLGAVLPALYPTTTIGSFPQTAKVRQVRSQYRSGAISQQEYDQFIREEIARTIQIQEECGLDVLVHGESERTDMVEFFGEYLQGFSFTSNGWVQSYGSRCVKPPIIYGDVQRRSPMTVELATYSQSLTTKPVKGMLTGPVTCLQWSFVRDDIPRSETCLQLALSIRDEVADLATISKLAIVQIDEPAIREGLPLRRNQWDNHLKWSVNCFKLATSGVEDNVQIHTHMCYSDFNDIFKSLQDMDADVLTIENSKSDAKLLSAFASNGYTNEIGPGVYDIHSPRVPTVEEMLHRVQQINKFVSSELLWVNPDCGLKTRNHAETIAALKNMVQIATVLRSSSTTATTTSA